MVAEHGFDSMAMNNFIDKINDLEAAITPQDPVPANIVDLFRMINVGFQVFHKQAMDINNKVDANDIPQKINTLDLVTQQINTNLHTLANQVAQRQAVQGPQQQQHNTGILEFKVVQHIKPLTGNKSQFIQWHQQLINALSTINEDHAEIIKAIEKSMDSGQKIDEALDDLDQQFHLYEFNMDLLCILTDKCEGEAYDKIKGLQNNKGAEVYMIIYRWFTDISGLGLSMQAAKLMNPDPIKKEAYL